MSAFLTDNSTTYGIPFMVTSGGHGGHGGHHDDEHGKITKEAVKAKTIR